MTERNVYLEYISLYGESLVLTDLIVKLSELITVICKLKRFPDDYHRIKDVLEEAVDAQISLNQLKYLLYAYTEEYAKHGISGLSTFDEVLEERLKLLQERITDLKYKE